MRNRVRSEGEVVLETKLASILAESDVAEQERLLAELVDGTEADCLRSTLDDLLNLEQTDLMKEAALCLIRRWVAVDGAAAAAWAAQLPAGPLREMAMSDVAIEWAKAGLEDASTWARQLPDEAERSAAVAAVANEAVRSEPMKALTLALGLPDSPARQELMMRGAMEWASVDGGAAAKWAVRMPEGPARDKVISAIATVWSESNPVDAAVLATGEIQEGRAQSDAIIGIVQRWAQNQPDKTANWVEQFPEGQLKQTAAENIEVLRRNAEER